MPEKPLLSGDDGLTEEEHGGTVRLVQSALVAPTPPAEAEQESQERVLAQFPDGSLPPRPLHELPPDSEAGSSLVHRVGRALRRILRS